jgi:hypothetical protein
MADSVFDAGATVDSFAGFPVTDYAAAVAWHNRLWGREPAFLPNDIEAVWEVAAHRYAFVKVQPDDAGHAFNLFFLDDLDTFLAGAAGRGVEPAVLETLGNGVRRAVFRDPDGNEVGFGGGPAA